MTRSAFLSEVAKAAEKTRKRRRRVRTVSETSLDALAGAREADPMRGVRVARQVPRCGKIKRSDGRPCRAPRVRGGTRCRWHGGLRQVPDHPGNVKRLLNGTFTAQAAYKVRMKTLGEYWRQLTLEEQGFLREFLTPEEWADMEMVDLAARCWIESRVNPWAWHTFARQMRRRRETAGA